MKENLLAWEETMNVEKNDNRRRDKSSWVSSSANEKEYGQLPSGVLQWAESEISWLRRRERRRILVLNKEEKGKGTSKQSGTLEENQ